MTNTQRPHDSSDPPSKAVCNNCGSQNPKKQYPAFGKQCRKCNKLNHFAKCCRSSKHKIEAVDSSPKPDLMFVGAIEHSNRTKLGADECHTTLNIERLLSKHTTKFVVQAAEHSITTSKVNHKTYKLQWGRSQGTELQKFTLSRQAN